VAGGLADPIDQAILRACLALPQPFAAARGSARDAPRLVLGPDGNRYVANSNSFPFESYASCVMRLRGSIMTVVRPLARESVVVGTDL
jgi:hypothetical protein